MVLTGRQEASLVPGLHPLCWATQGKSLTLSESSKGNMVLTNTEGFVCRKKNTLHSTQVWAACEVPKYMLLTPYVC